MRYNNYHKHDHISNIFTPDVNVHAEDYMKKCVEYGHTNYFTTNHGSFGDIFEARTLCDQYGLRCIAGIEGYIVPDPLEKDKRNYHIIIIPKTDKARKKMNYVSSMASIRGYYYKPRIFIDDLLKLDADDIYITSACCAGLLRDSDAIEQMLLPLVNHFGENVMLEIQNHNVEIQKDINKKALAMSQDLGLRLIAANDSHWIGEGGMQERLELLKGKGITYDDEDTFILDFPDYEEMFRRFQVQGILTDSQIEEAIANTLLFDECEEIQLDHSIKMPTIYPKLTPDERYELLEKEVWRRFEEVKVSDEITNEELPKYIDGINYELKTIKDTNDEIHTADYFLLNEKIVKKAVEEYDGVLTRGGRGSCASFYINRLLGMTQLDRFRIKLPIYPDRFASTARLLENRALPDIDYNVKSQEEFVRATRDLLGENGCYPMIAYGTMQMSEAFRNVCRSHEIPHEEYNEVGKNLEAYESNKKWKPIIDEAKKYVGTVVSASVHPCAFCLSNKDILHEYGVVKVGDAMCVMITSGEADEYKVLKNDYLIVSVWKLISETFKEVGIPILPAGQLLAEIKDDKRIWDLFKNGITCTLNQVDSDNGMEQAKKYGISSFEEGAFIAAAIRPSFDSWREQFETRKPYTTGSKDLDEVLNITGGYILFQENLMQYFEWLGVTPAESIGLIKKISKKKIKQEDFDNLEGRLRENWIEKTGSVRMFKETWHMIQSCISYGFAAPHAAATSLDMCYGAYLKVHYPYEYYTVCFNNYVGDETRTRKLRDELRYFGITLGGIKFRNSKSDYTYDKKQKMIHKGMGSIKYMNAQVSDELYTLRNNQYVDFAHLLDDIGAKTTADSRQIEILIRLDFFSEFGEINQLLDIYKMYKLISNRKTIKIADVGEKYPIPMEVFADNAEKVTDKQMRFDSYGISRVLDWYIDNHQTEPCSVSDIIKAQQEYLGYIDYTNPNADKREIVVMDLNVKYSPKFLAYSIKTGQSCPMKVYKNYNRRAKANYKTDPFKEGDVLYMKECKREPKKVWDGERWIPSKDEMEWWLYDYKLIS